MREYVIKRVLDEAEFIVSTKSTIRQTAKEFNVSKSTVHVDLTERLYRINPALSKEVKKIMEVNKDESCSRGGIAMKNKFNTKNSVGRIE